MQPRTLAAVDLNLLKALGALLQERSVTRAADRLSITQPSMSAALGRLRELFADELLVRTGRTMRPTPFAQKLEPEIRRILAEIEEIVAPKVHFDPEHAVHTFTVLATDYTALILIQPLMAALATEAPNIQIQLESRDIADHSARLQRTDIDLAIVPARFSHTTGLPKETLFTDRFVAAAWRGNGEVSDPLTLQQLELLPYLSYKLGPVESMVDTLLEELGHHREADTLVESFLVGPLLLRGTRQITFLQERLARQLAEVAQLRVVEPPFAIPILVETMTWHPRSTHDTAHSWLRARIYALAQTLEPASPAYQSVALETGDQGVPRPSDIRS
jgi:DNA-binding transcriptional LysR family regulator